MKSLITCQEAWSWFHRQLGAKGLLSIFLTWPGHEGSSDSWKGHSKQTGGRESGSLSVFIVSGKNKEIWTNGDTMVDKEEGEIQIGMSKIKPMGNGIHMIG